MCQIQPSSEKPKIAIQTSKDVKIYSILSNFHVDHEHTIEINNRIIESFIPKSAKSKDLHVIVFTTESSVLAYDT
jgi:hypothetical protein